MNLSNQQVKVLAKTLYSTILEKQREQLNSFKDEYKEEIKRKLLEENKLIIESLERSHHDIIGVKLSNDFFERNGLKYSGYESSISKEGFIEHLTNRKVSETIRQEFEKRFGPEAKLELIEDTIVLETIGAKTIEELTEAVKKKFFIS